MTLLVTPAKIPTKTKGRGRNKRMPIVPAGSPPPPEKKKCKSATIAVSRPVMIPMKTDFMMMFRKGDTIPNSIPITIGTGKYSGRNINIGILKINKKVANRENTKPTKPPRTQDFLNIFIGPPHKFPEVFLNLKPF